MAEERSAGNRREREKMHREGEREKRERCGAGKVGGKGGVKVKEEEGEIDKRGGEREEV